MERVILVDENNCEIGTAEKLAVHQNGGMLHRAFSIFVFDETSRLLLQRRAVGKYHFGNLWTNTCCGHPRPGEIVTAAAQRRLHEEFGIETSLQPIGETTYIAEDAASGLTEREYLHILVARFDGEPKPNPEEIGAFRWQAISEIEKELSAKPETFTPWFALILQQFSNKLDEFAKGV